MSDTQTFPAHQDICLVATGIQELCVWRIETRKGDTASALVQEGSVLVGISTLRMRQDLLMPKVSLWLSTHKSRSSQTTTLMVRR